MKLFGSFKVCCRVLIALMLREVRSIYGNYRLSYLWALLEPMFHVLTVYFISSIVGGRTPIGLSMIGMILTGIMPWLLFSRTMVCCMDAVKENISLMTYPQVMPLDTIFARCILEFTTTIVTFIILLAIFIIFGHRFPINNIVSSLLSLIYASLIAFGLGTFFFSLKILLPSIDKIVRSFLRPLYFISGIFFTANAMPQIIMNFLWYNPILHITELLRGGMFSTYRSIHAYHSYLLIWSLSCVFLGLISEKATRGNKF